MKKLLAWLSKLWHRIYDDIEVWAATLIGVVASMLWPAVLAMATQGVLPRLGYVDLVRLFGAIIIAVVLAARESKDTTLDQRKTKVAIQRRVKAAFSRGFAWQAAVAAVTALAAGK